MADGVRDEFAQNAQKRVGGVLGEPFARNGEAGDERRLAEMWLQRPPDGFVEVSLVEGGAPKVPDAVLEFLPTGSERLRGSDEMGMHGVWVVCHAVGCLERQCDAGQVLRDGVV